ncbi:MAG: hypothetical protein LBU91_00820 [Bacteroidales bacterium]|jgi:hypothetical protein|nr:hypothetical protein [Bacteroidales bacterium]
MTKLVKTSLFIGTLIGLTLAANIILKSSKPIAEHVDAKEVIEHVETYIGKTIETEGRIVHVCGVSKKKMRLYVENIGSINIITEKPNLTFDGNFNQKDIKVVGTVKEIRITSKQIDDMEQSIAIPCSIDRLACIDTAYVENKRRNGTLEKSSQQGIEQSRETMKETGKDYISIVTIVAESVDLK